MGTGIKRKVKKSFALDERSYEVVRRFTEMQGISMSSWLTGLLNEVAKQIEGQPAPYDKPIGKMTIEELANVMLYWKRSFDELEAEEEAHGGGFAGGPDEPLLNGSGEGEKSPKA